MSVNLRNLAIDTFQATAQRAFQSGSRLRDRVMVVTGVEGESRRFPVFGTSDVTARSSQGLVVPANVRNVKPRAILEPVEWYEYLDKQDQAVTNVDTLRNYGEIGGRAVGRKIDGLIIDAVANYDSAAYSRDGLSANLEHTVGTAGTLGADDMATAVAMLMDEMDADGDAELTLVAPALQFAEWTKDTKLANFDYLQQGMGQENVTKKGMFETIYGFKPILIGQQARRAGKGRLPTDRAYLFDKRCIGLAIGTIENMGDVEWSADRRSWLVSAETNAGTTRTNNSGFIEIKIR